MTRKLFSLFALIVVILLQTGCSGKIKAEDSTKLYLAAMDAYSHEQYTESLAYIDMIKKHYNGFYQADFLKGKILFFQNDYEGATKIFKSLCKKHPQYEEARIWYIRTLILSKNYDTARKLLEKELTFNQTDWRVYYLYSVLEEAQENIDKKIIMLNRAEMALTDSAKVYMELADLWSVLDMNDRSADYLLKAKIVTGTNASMSSLQEAIKKVE